MKTKLGRSSLAVFETAASDIRQPAKKRIARTATNVRPTVSEKPRSVPSADSEFCIGSRPEAWDRSSRRKEALIDFGLRIADCGFGVMSLLLRKWDWRKRSPSPRPSPPGEG